LPAFGIVSLFKGILFYKVSLYATLRRRLRLQVFRRRAPGGYGRRRPFILQGFAERSFIPRPRLPPSSPVLRKGRILPVRAPGITVCIRPGFFRIRGGPAGRRGSFETGSRPS